MTTQMTNEELAKLNATVTLNYFELRFIQSMCAREKTRRLKFIRADEKKGWKPKPGAIDMNKLAIVTQGEISDKMEDALTDITTKAPAP